MLGAVTVAAVVVAALLHKPLWAALVGGGLMLAYWGLEALTWRRARKREGLALGLAVGEDDATEAGHPAVPVGVQALGIGRGLVT